MILNWTSNLYEQITSARNALFDRGLLRTRFLPCPVISVGNITAGGTGKTPTVISVCEHLLALDLRPVVLSRGYRRTSRGIHEVQIQQSLSAAFYGDEPVLIARHFGGQVPVFVGASRFEAGRFALEKIDNPGNLVFVLDDGLQHRYLHRDLELVLIASENLQRVEQLRSLPVGRARENIAIALQRAHAVVITRAPERDEEYSVLLNRLQKFMPTDRSIPILKGRNVLQGTLRSLDGNHIVGAEQLRDQAVILACGLGVPEQFAQSIETQYGARCVERIFWPDHHRPSADDLLRIESVFKTTEAAWVLVTEKDAVKLESLKLSADLLGRVLVVSMKMIVSPADQWRELITQSVRRQ